MESYRSKEATDLSELTKQLQEAINAAKFKAQNIKPKSDGDIGHTKGTAAGRTYGHNDGQSGVRSPTKPASLSRSDASPKKAIYDQSSDIPPCIEFVENKEDIVNHGLEGRAAKYHGGSVNMLYVNMTYKAATDIQSELELAYASYPDQATMIEYVREATRLIMATKTAYAVVNAKRSEEHTSELQSH